MSNQRMTLIKGQQDEVVLGALQYALTTQDARGVRGGIAGGEIVTLRCMSRNALEAMVEAGWLEQAPERGFDVLYRVTAAGRAMLASRG